MLKRTISRKQANSIAKSDEAYSGAEAKARLLGEEVGANLVHRYRAGAIDEPGIHRTVAQLLEQAASEPGVTLPNFALRPVLAVVRDTIYQQLRDAGADINFEVSRHD